MGALTALTNSPEQVRSSTHSITVTVTDCSGTKQRPLLVWSLTQQFVQKVPLCGREMLGERRGGDVQFLGDIR